jgi:hypothetical protein
MTRWLLLAFALGVADEAGAADPPAEPLVSLDRIRAGLARPPALDLSIADPSLHFHVEVQGQRYFREMPPIWDIGSRRGPARPPVFAAPGSPALMQVDLFGVGRQVASAVSKARRARAARAARGEVEETLRGYCADRDCDPR